MENPRYLETEYIYMVPMIFIMAMSFVWETMRASLRSFNLHSD